MPGALLYIAGYGVSLAFLLAALWLPGRLLEARLVASREDHSFPAAVGIGMAIWSLVLCALAAAGWLRPGILRVLAAGAAALALASLVAHARRRLGTGLGMRGRWRALGGSAPVALAGGALAAIGAGWFFLAALPSVGWDDAVYHLRLPRLYLEAGGFRWVPFSMYSHWPQGMELLYALAMALRDHVLAKLLHWSTAALAAAVVVHILRRVAPPLVALAGGALLIANPVFLFEARFAYVDVALAFFFALAFRALELAGAPAGTELGGQEGRDVRTQQRRQRLLVTAGLCIGAMTATKLTGWLGVAAIGGAWLAGAARAARSPGGARRLLREGWALAAPVLALALPWHLKAWLDTGNPIYPFAFARFGGAEWSAGLATEFAALSAAASGKLVDLPGLVLRLAAGAVPGTDGSGGALAPVWVAALPLALFGALRGGARRAQGGLARRALACGGLYFLLWSLGPQQIRYLLPALPLFAIAAAVGLGELVRLLPRRAAEWSTAAAILAVLAWVTRPALAGAPALFRQLVQHGPALRELMVHPALRYLNEETPAEARILFLNTNKAFACRREVLADSIFEASQIADWLRTARDRDQLEGLLTTAGVTHVLWEHVDWGIRYPPELLALLDDPERAAPLYRSPEGRFTVLELRLTGGDRRSSPDS